MTLLDQVVKSTGTQQADAMREYRAIIEREQSPQPGDGERLIELRRVLEISVDEMYADVNAIRTVRQLEGERISKTVLGQLAADLATKNLEREEAARIEDQARDRRFKLNQETGIIQAQIHSAANVNADRSGRIEKLRADHPRVFVS